MNEQEKQFVTQSLKLAKQITDADAKPAATPDIAIPINTDVSEPINGTEKTPPLAEGLISVEPIPTVASDIPLPLNTDDVAQPPEHRTEPTLADIQFDEAIKLEEHFQDIIPNVENDYMRHPNAMGISHAPAQHTFRLQAVALKYPPLFLSDPIVNGDTFSVTFNNTLNKGRHDGVLGNDRRVTAHYDIIITDTTDNGNLTISPNGGMQYTPNTDYIGSDTFQYQLRHVRTGELSEVVTVTINVDASGALSSGNDTLSLGNIANLIQTASADFTAGDTITGGTATDTVNFTDTATITTAELANKTGIDVIKLNADGNSLELNDSFVDASDNDTVTLNNQTYTVTSLDVTDLDSARTVVIGGTGAVTLAAAGQTVTAADGVNTHIIGGTGDDIITNGSGTDVFSTGNGNDIFYTSDTDFVAADTFTGGAGSDTLSFTDAATITTAELANKTGIDAIQFSADGNSLELNDSFVDASDNDTVTLNNQTYTVTSLDVTDLDSARTVVIGGTGTVTLAAGGQTITAADGINTHIIGGTGDDIITNGSGTDVFSTGNGNDIFYTSDTDFVAADTFTGGAGSDTLSFTDAATITTAELANKTGIDAIQFSADGNSLELNDSFVDASDNDTVTLNNQTYTVTSLDVTDLDSARTVVIGGTGTVTLAAAGQTVTAADGVNTHIIGGTGGDVITNGSGTDVFSTGNGNDTVYTTDANFGAADTIDAGGATDILVFTDAAAVTIADLTNKTGIERIRFTADGNTVQLNDAFVDSSGNDSIMISNQTYTVTSLDIGDVTGSRSVVVSGTGQVTLADGGQTVHSLNGYNTHIVGGSGDDRFVNGSGTDTLIGMAGADTFETTNSHFKTTDVYTGGTGEDNLLFTDAVSLAATSKLANKTGIDKITLSQDGNVLTLSDSFVDASDSDIITIDNQTYTVTSLDISDLDSARSAIIAGTGTVTLAAGDQTITAADGVNTTIVNGSGTDTINGGTGDDMIQTSEANFTAADTFTAGAGSDTLSFTDAATITTAELANKTGIDIIQFAADGNSLELNDSFVDASDSDTVTLNNQTYTVTSLDVTNLNSARTVVVGGTGTVTLAAGGQTVTAADGVNTHIIGGSGYDTFYNASGSNTFIGNDGYDDFYTSNADLSATDVFSGGAGFDRLEFTDAANITIAMLANKTGIDEINISAGGSITLNDAFVDTTDSDSLRIYNQGSAITLDVTDLDAARTVELLGDGTVTLADGGQTVSMGSTNSTTSTVLGDGDDQIIGHSGTNLFTTTSANLTAADVLTGNGGYDILKFSDAVTLTTGMLANKTGIDEINISTINGSVLTLNDTFVDASDDDRVVIYNDGRTFTLDVTDLDAARAVEINGKGVVTLAAGGQTVYGKDGLNVNIQGGSGDDVMYRSSGDSGNGRFDGNAGFDTLGSIDTSAFTLTGVAGIKLNDIEKIDISDGSQTLTLTAQDVLDMSSSTDTLFVYGGSNDAVTSTGEGWIAGSTSVAADGLTYQLYTSGSATLGVYTTDSMTITLS